MKLVTAIMPTRGRREFAERAVISFLSQTYQDKELIILDDADDPSFDLKEWPATIKYYRTDKRFSVGEKRNRCCELATGEIIAHWDSDDWSDPGRIELQVRLLEESGKAVVGFKSLAFYDVDRAIAAVWDADRELGPDSRYALGSSLLYEKSWWAAHRFNDQNIAEDNEFVRIAANDNQLHVIHGELNLIARVHRGNTSGKDIDGMHPIDASTLPTEFIH